MVQDTREAGIAVAQNLSPESVRKPYRAPKLSDLGLVAALIRSAGGSGVDAGTGTDGVS